MSITGTNFLAGALVLFGTASAPTVTVNNATQIQAITPAKAAGLVDVAVQNPDGQAGIMTGGFTYTAPAGGPPSITSISPNSGTPGTQVTINGTNFASGATLSFGTVNASSATLVSATQLTVSVPVEPPGVVDVKVTNPGGSSFTFPSGFTVAAPQSLLAGVTPATLTVPSGWTLVTTQDFESGSLPASQSFNPQTSISSTFSHTGSKAAVATIAGNSADAVWALDGNSVGSFSDVYVSWYDFKESQGRMNDEFFIATLHEAAGTGDLVFDFYGYGSSPTNTGFNAVTASQIIFEWEDQVSGGANNTIQYGPGHAIPWGAWEQWEFWFHNNTGSNSDGFFQVFVNGQLFWQKTNVNFTKNRSYNNSSVQIGGSYTKVTWTAPGGGCGQFIGDGDDFTRPPVSDFNNLQCPNQGPPNGKVPIFKRYYDDIIVLKK